jgi:hypothetical protein
MPIGIRGVPVLRGNGYLVLIAVVLGLLAGPAVLLRSPQDVVVIKSPSWWTPSALRGDGHRGWYRRGQAEAHLRRFFSGRWVHGAQVWRDGVGPEHLLALVELMGGRIWVESTLGDGSAFHFTASMREGRGGGKRFPWRAGEPNWCAARWWWNQIRPCR